MPLVPQKQPWVVTTLTASIIPSPRCNRAVRSITHPGYCRRKRELTYFSPPGDRASRWSSYPPDALFSEIASPRSKVHSGEHAPCNAPQSGSSNVAMRRRHRLSMIAWSIGTLPIRILLECRLTQNSRGNFPSRHPTRSRSSGAFGGILL